MSKCGYDIKKKLGKGSFGDVSLISDDKGNLFAFKNVDNGIYGMNSINEVNILMSIKHDNVLTGFKVYNSKNCDMKKNHTGIVTELLSISLYTYINDKQPYKYEENYKDNIIKIMKDVYRGVYALHDLNILHLDIKPENILIKLDDKGNVVKAVIADMGSCIYSGDATKLRKYVKSLGTLMYEPLERLDEYLCNSKTDVYSLGLTFLECFGGTVLVDKFFDEESRVSTKLIYKIIKDRDAVYDIIANSLRPYFNKDIEGKEMIKYTNMLCDSITKYNDRITMEDCIKTLEIDYESPSLSTYFIGNYNYDIIQRVSKMIIREFRVYAVAEQVTLAVDILYAHLSNVQLESYPSDLVLANTYNLIAFKSLNKLVINSYSDRAVFVDTNKQMINEILDFEMTVIADLNGLVNGDRPFYHDKMKHSELAIMMTKPSEYSVYFNEQMKIK